MKFRERVLLFSILVVWCSIFFKYETIALLARGGSSGGGSRAAGSSSGARFGSSSGGSRGGSSSSGSRFGSSGGSDSSNSRSHRISNTIHRIGDKISDKFHHRHNPKPDPAPAPKQVQPKPSNQDPPVKPQPNVPYPQKSNNQDLPPPYPGQQVNPKQQLPLNQDLPPPYPGQQVQPKPSNQDPPVKPQPNVPYPQKSNNQDLPPPYPGQQVNPKQQLPLNQDLPPPYPFKPQPNAPPYPENTQPKHQPSFNQDPPPPYPQQPFKPQPNVPPYPEQPIYPRPQAPSYPHQPGIYTGGGSGPGSSGIGNKIRSGAGALVMGTLAKKIFSSGRHTGVHHNHHSGMYHNYNYRPHRYGEIKGEVCVNNENYDGIVYGQFICPIDGFDYDETSCCGRIGSQYCCSPKQAAVHRSNGYSATRGDVCVNTIDTQGVAFGQFECPVVGFAPHETRCCGAMNSQYCCSPSQADAERLSIESNNNHRYNKDYDIPPNPASNPQQPSDLEHAKSPNKPTIEPQHQRLLNSEEKLDSEQQKPFNPEQQKLESEQKPYNPEYKPPDSEIIISGSGRFGIHDDNKIRKDAGAHVMEKLAKKILESGRHTGSRHDHLAGMYHSYNYRPHRYGMIRGHICVNFEKHHGIEFGQFMCPIDGFNYDETSCCGPVGAQYCCSANEAAASSRGDRFPSGNSGERIISNVGILVCAIMSFLYEF